MKFDPDVGIEAVRKKRKGMYKRVPWKLMVMAYLHYSSTFPSILHAAQQSILSPYWQPKSMIKNVVCTAKKKKASRSSTYNSKSSRCLFHFLFSQLRKLSLASTSPIIPVVLPPVTTIVFVKLETIPVRAKLPFNTVCKFDGALETVCARPKLSKYLHRF